MNEHTILVVDDNAQILKLTKDVFEFDGFNVITAEDGQCALHILNEKKIDLVVTDILMPNVDGYILCYTIRTSQKLKDLPVIIYSATYTSSSDEATAMEIGADKFIRKPASMNELRTAAQFLLSSTRVYQYRTPSKPESLEAMRLYSEGLVNKLEKRNLELEQAKEELEQGKARLNEAQTIAHLGSWEIDMVRNTQQWSDELFNILGINKEEEEPSTELFLSTVYTDDFDYVNKKVKKAFSSLMGSSFEYRFVRLDGALRHGYSKYHFEFDKDRKPLRLYGIVQDITERKVIEEELVYKQSRLKEAQAIAHIGSWEIDIPKNTQIWSDELYEIYGKSKGKDIPCIDLFLSIIHPDDITFAKEKIHDAFNTLQGSSFDFRFINNEGAVKYGYSKWRFEFDKNHNPIKLFGITQDVTERKLAEIEREKMVNDLLIRNRDLEQFAYIVSHNLRAPVANILGTTNELNQPGLCKEEMEILNDGLNESVTKLDNVVKDLSYILQVKREIYETKEIVRFSGLVEDIKISIKNLIDKDTIEIRYDFTAIDEFFTLKAYLYSIFYNLISNSIKYRQQQVPCLIKIKSRVLKDKIELRFSDNGMGIDLHKKGDQVFGLYKRFHKNIEGKGMGLFMVKVQVEALGGKISITSEVNKGTEFQIEFEK